MLVLIAGVTGNLGSRMIDSFISRGHQVRGLGRNPSKLPSELRQKLENFVEVSSSVDVTGLEKACHGVDAVVCAYQGHPELVVEGQLLLLRAAERMGVKRFVANSWNCDWRDMTLGMQETYDPMLTFQQLVITLLPNHGRRQGIRIYWNSPCPYRRGLGSSFCFWFSQIMDARLYPHDCRGVRYRFHAYNRFWRQSKHHDP